MFTVEFTQEEIELLLLLLKSATFSGDRTSLPTILATAASAEAKLKETQQPKNNNGE